MFYFQNSYGGIRCAQIAFLLFDYDYFYCIVTNPRKQTISIMLHMDLLKYRGKVVRKKLRVNKNGRIQKGILKTICLYTVYVKTTTALNRSIFFWSG